MTLTIHLLISNNIKTINDTLKSLENTLHQEGVQLIIGNLGAKDGSIDVCKQYTDKIIDINLDQGYAHARNDLIAQYKSDWHMYLQPYEALIDFVDIKNLKNDKPKWFYVIEGGTITKPIRIWQKEKFCNPVFEYIDADDAEDGNIRVFSTSENKFNENMKLIKSWKSHDLGAEPYYYEACLHLMNRDYHKFIEASEHYFFKNKHNTMATVLLRYYYAGVQHYVFNNSKKALMYLTTCLAAKPLMAEFWCLLGDIFYNKDANKAKCFYENAIIFGSRRPKSDQYPIQIDKYRTYPNKMIQSCIELDQSIEFVLG